LKKPEKYEWQPGSGGQNHVWFTASDGTFAGGTLNASHSLAATVWKTLKRLRISGGSDNKIKKGAICAHPFL
jgi:hypothetical protein